MSDSHSSTPLPDVNVEKIMTAKVHSVTLEMTVRQAIGLLLEHKISGAPVVDVQKKVITVVSETDLMKIAAKSGLDKTIADCLEYLPKSIIALSKNTPFTELYRTFLKHPIHRIIIVDLHGRLQGLVSRSNVLRILYGDPNKKTEVLPITNIPHHEKKRSA